VTAGRSAALASRIGMSVISPLTRRERSNQHAGGYGFHPTRHRQFPHRGRRRRSIPEGLLMASQSLAAADPGTRFLRVRQRTLELCANLNAEDLQLQSMPDASPGKWHLAHTSWFFEQFVLGRDPACRPRDPAWHYLFNSYYQSVGVAVAAIAGRGA
jgi:hypothetical protein